MPILDIPVLVGVGKDSRATLEGFVGGMGQMLDSEPTAIHHWRNAAIKDGKT